MNKNQNIPVFILAGGLGTRISEETHLKPKPMVEVGDVPVLLHLMRWYYSFGFNDFVICAGYRSWEIKNFFLDYQFRQNHISIDHRAGHCSPMVLGTNMAQENWRVRVIDTGVDCMTGARIARAFDFLREVEKESFQDFAVTYGDGLSNVNLNQELDYHLEHQKLGTVLAVPPFARFGELDVQGKRVTGFIEKPEDKQGLINGGFFFFKSDFRNYLETDLKCTLERAPLVQLAKDNHLMMYEHRGFWHPMDTLRDKVYLQGLWESGKAPWCVG